MSTDTALRFAFSTAARMAAGSLSRASTGPHPSLAAAIAITPEPQPRSNGEPEQCLSAERALDLPEHALVRAEVVVGHRVSKLGVQLALLAVEVARDDHVHDHAQIPTAMAAERRHSGPAHFQGLVRLDTG